eukprot:781165-Lingulodinium_polyedra.AAC.1
MAFVIAAVCKHHARTADLPLAVRRLRVLLRPRTPPQAHLQARAVGLEVRGELLRHHKTRGVHPLHQRRTLRHAKLA